jgi:glutathione S-transferase
MKLYGHPYSTCTRKVLTTLAEKGHEAEFVLVDLMKGEHKSPAHLARQPFGQVPALEDDGFALYESRAIMRYLDAKLPGPSLTPPDLKGRAVMEQWISIESANFSPGALKVILQKFFKPMGGGVPDEAIIADGRASASRALDVLEPHLAKNTYLAGEAFTLADISYMPYVGYLYQAGEAELINSRRSVAAWWGRVSERPSWRKVAG